MNNYHWFRVGERKPAPGMAVLVCTKSKNGSRNIDKGYMTEDLRWVHRGTAAVTHWTLLPDLPKE